MPTYEYSCDSCGNDFEVFQKMSDEPVHVCPKCGHTVHRVLSSSIGISFKGSGFYVNDSHAKEKEPDCPAGESAKGTEKACAECAHAAEG